MKTQKLSESNFEEFVEMAHTLWPDTSKEEISKEYREQISSDRYKVLLAQDEEEFIGFVAISIRTDYVEGCKSSPVGYVEGIFIKPQFRKQGLAKELVKIAAEWSKQHGCTELGSCAEIENVESQNFHTSIGFKKANTTVNFIKKI